MRITLERHGGLAALRYPPKRIDGSALPPVQLLRLTELIEAAKRGSAAKAADTSKVRDGMTYVISIEDKGESAVLSQSDGGLSADFAALLTWIQKFPAS
jgi:hypothetical protein